MPVTTLHVGDDSGRVCLVETKTLEDALPVATPANISRYQYGNHLGTVGLELDGAGQLISYEEFHPYGRRPIAQPTPASR